MFRVKIEESTSKTFRMPNSLLKKLENLSYEKNISLSKLVIQCCEYAMENLENEDSKNNDKKEIP